MSCHNILSIFVTNYKNIIIVKYFYELCFFSTADRGFIEFDDFVKTVSKHWNDVTSEEEIIECFKVAVLVLLFPC